MIDQRDRFERAFEVFEMPEPAFERMLGRRAHQRASRRAATAAIAVLVSVASIAVLIRAFGVPDRSVGSGPTKISQARAGQILDRVVIPFDEPPQGMTFLLAKSGISALGDPFQDLVAPGWARDGFVDGRLNMYRNRGTDRYLTSHALVYEDPDAAAAVFARLEKIATDPRPGGLGFPRGEPLGVGDEGWGFETRVDDGKDCGRRRFSLWRSGAVIMMIKGCQPARLASDRLAVRMQAGLASEGIG